MKCRNCGFLKREHQTVKGVKNICPGQLTYDDNTERILAGMYLVDDPKEFERVTKNATLRPGLYRWRKQ